MISLGKSEGECPSFLEPLFPCPSPAEAQGLEVTFWAMHQLFQGSLAFSLALQILPLPSPVQAFCLHRVHHQRSWFSRSQGGRQQTVEFLSFHKHMSQI